MLSASSDTSRPTPFAQEYAASSPGFELQLRTRLGTVLIAMTAKCLDVGGRHLVFVGGREVDAKLLGLRNEKKVSFDMSSVTDEDDMNAALETLSTSEPGWVGAY
mgnify:CR=1 FL=1